LHGEDADAVTAKSSPAKIVQPGAMINKEDDLSRKTKTRVHCDRALYTRGQEASLHQGPTGGGDKHNEYVDVAKGRATHF
jgi:hypothetical protein